MKEIIPIKKIDNKQPSNLEAEQALLGSILINNDIIDEISSIVTSSATFMILHILRYSKLFKI